MTDHPHIDLAEICRQEVQCSVHALGSIWTSNMSWSQAEPVLTACLSHAYMLSPTCRLVYLLSYYKESEGSSLHMYSGRRKVDY